MKKKNNEMAENVSSYGAGDNITSSTTNLELRQHEKTDTNPDTNKNRLAGCSISVLKATLLLNSTLNAFTLMNSI